MTEKSMKLRGEDAACAFLERSGIAVFERKWKCEAGTIDVLAWDGDQLVLVDVRTRKAAGQKVSQGVSTASSRRIRKVAEAYIEHAGLQGTTWRFDRIDLLVISVDRALLRHQRDAVNTSV